MWTRRIYKDGQTQENIVTDNCLLMRLLSAVETMRCHGQVEIDWEEDLTGITKVFINTGDKRIVFSLIREEEQA